MEWSQEGVLELEGVTMVEWSVDMPSFSGTKKEIKRLQRYYSRVISVWKQHWFDEIYQQACEDGLPRVVSLEGEGLWLEEGLYSVGLTVKEQGRKTQEHFFGDLWEEGIPVLTKGRAPFLGRKRKEILEKIISLAQEKEDYFFYSDYIERIPWYFSYENVRFLEEGVDVFFQQETIAHGLEGIPKFFIPYSW